MCDERGRCVQGCLDAYETDTSGRCEELYDIPGYRLEPLLSGLQIFVYDNQFSSSSQLYYLLDQNSRWNFMQYHKHPLNANQDIKDMYPGWGCNAAEQSVTYSAWIQVTFSSNARIDAVATHASFSTYFDDFLQYYRIYFSLDNVHFRPVYDDDLKLRMFRGERNPRLEYFQPYLTARYLRLHPYTNSTLAAVVQWEVFQLSLLLTEPPLLLSQDTDYISLQMWKTDRQLETRLVYRLYYRVAGTGAEYQYVDQLKQQELKKVVTVRNIPFGYDVEFKTIIYDMHGREVKYFLVYYKAMNVKLEFDGVPKTGFLPFGSHATYSGPVLVFTDAAVKSMTFGRVDYYIDKISSDVFELGAVTYNVTETTITASNKWQFSAERLGHYTVLLKKNNWIDLSGGQRLAIRSNLVLSVFGLNSTLGLYLQWSTSYLVEQDCFDSLVVGETIKGIQRNVYLDFYPAFMNLRLFRVVQDQLYSFVPATAPTFYSCQCQDNVDCHPMIGTCPDDACGVGIAVITEDGNDTYRWSGPDCQDGPISVGKWALHSGGTTECRAMGALDGKTASLTGQYACPSSDAEVWWLLALVVLHRISNVTIYNVATAESTLLNNLVVSSAYVQKVYMYEVCAEYPETVAAGQKVTLECNSVGRSLRITKSSSKLPDSFAMAEVVVEGRKLHQGETNCDQCSEAGCLRNTSCRYCTNPYLAPQCTQQCADNYYWYMDECIMCNSNCSTKNCNKTNGMCFACQQGIGPEGTCNLTIPTVTNIQQPQVLHLDWHSVTLLYFTSDVDHVLFSYYQYDVFLTDLDSPNRTMLVHRVSFPTYRHSFLLTVNGLRYSSRQVCSKFYSLEKQNPKF